MKIKFILLESKIILGDKNSLANKSGSKRKRNPNLLFPAFASVWFASQFSDLAIGIQESEINTRPLHRPKH
jgi:hypothetical protein